MKTHFFTTFYYFFQNLPLSRKISLEKEEMPKKLSNGKIYCSRCKKSYPAEEFYEKHFDHNFNNKSTQTDEIHRHKFASQVFKNNIVVVCTDCGEIKVVKQFLEISASLYEKQDKKRVKFGKK